MKHISLMYHDIVASQNSVSASGFLDPGANRYKVSADAFNNQLGVARSARSDCPIAPAELSSSDDYSWSITFDDGGAGAHAFAVDCLSKHAFLATFLLVTDQLNSPGFLTNKQVRQIRQMGHTIGTHTRSHPSNITSLPYRVILKEWSDSRDYLEQLLGENVFVGSVPYGNYSAKVGDAAKEAGITILYTSLPTTKVQIKDDCLTLGRFAITNKTVDMDIASVLSISTVSKIRMQQNIGWRARTLLKNLLGNYYIAFRDFYVEKNPDRSS